VVLAAGGVQMTPMVEPRRRDYRFDGSIGIGGL
jgi:hypothetical protein